MHREAAGKVCLVKNRQTPRVHDGAAKHEPNYPQNGRGDKPTTREKHAYAGGGVDWSVATVSTHTTRVVGRQRERAGRCQQQGQQKGVWGYHYPHILWLCVLPQKQGSSEHHTVARGFGQQGVVDVYICISIQRRLAAVWWRNAQVLAAHSKSRHALVMQGSARQL